MQLLYEMRLINDSHYWSNQVISLRLFFFLERILLLHGKQLHLLFQSKTPLLKECCMNKYSTIVSRYVYKNINFWTSSADRSFNAQ